MLARSLRGRGLRSENVPLARAFLRSFEAHSCSYVTKMIDKKAPSGRIRSSSSSTAQTPSQSYFRLPFWQVHHD